MTTALTLFDLAALNPAPDTPCTRCGGRRPASTRIRAARNLLGVMPPVFAPTTYRDLAPITSGPCCEPCAWQLGDAWWAAWRTCPTGCCGLWAHTLDNPVPHLNCSRHHDETRVVWYAPLEVA